MDAIEHPPIISLAPWGVPDYVFYAWIVMGILIIASFAATRRLELVPRSGPRTCATPAATRFFSLVSTFPGWKERHACWRVR